MDRFSFFESLLSFLGDDYLPLFFAAKKEMERKRIEMEDLLRVRLFFLSLHLDMLLISESDFLHTRTHASDRHIPILRRAVSQGFVGSFNEMGRPHCA